MIECIFDEESETMVCRFPPKKMDTFASIEAEKVFLRSFSEAMAAGSRAANIVFDLDGVNYVASSFLRLCVMAANKVERGSFSIVNTDPQVMKVYKIAGLESVLRVS